MPVIYILELDRYARASNMIKKTQKHHEINYVLPKPLKATNYSWGIYTFQTVDPPYTSGIHVKKKKYVTKTRIEKKT